MSFRAPTIPTPPCPECGGERPPGILQVQRMDPHGLRWRCRLCGHAWFRHYCPTCDNDAAFREDDLTETCRVGGHPVTATVRVLVCETCGDNQPHPDHDFMEPFYWGAAIELLRLGKRYVDEATPTKPNERAIERAIQWMSTQRDNGEHPPQLLIPEPGGGLIVEWQDEQNDPTLDVTFYNDGRAERCVWSNGRVQSIEALAE